MALKLLSGGAANGLVSALTDAFKLKTGLRIDGEFGAVGLMRDRVIAGEDVDLVILSPNLIEELTVANFVIRESITPVGEVVTGVAVQKGAALPDVSTTDTFRTLLLGADAIFVPHMSQSTAGAHIAKVFAKLGIAERVTKMIREYPNGQTAMTEMAKTGTTKSVGTTQITEILNTNGVKYVGDLPEPCALSTNYTAGIAAQARNASAAHDMIEILTAPKNAPVRKSAGFST